MNRWLLLEWIGIALIATALSALSIFIGIGLVGIYLFATAVIRQALTATPPAGKDTQDG